MSRIEFEQISDDLIEVVIPPETPMEMVQQLTKSFIARGLVEDLQKSTLSVRYFYRPENKINDLADQLIKSLQGIAKADELPYWHPKAQIANQKALREKDIAARRIKNGTTPMAPKPPAPPITPTSYTSHHPNMVDSTPAAMNTANNTGKRYAYIKDPVNKDEEDEDVEKSGYGPKKAGLYNPADNARRKSNNLDPVGFGPNVNAKAFSSKPGQMSAKASAALTARIQNKANKKQPVKVYSPEEKAALAEKMKMNKSWGQHLPFPSAEEEILRFAKNNSTQCGEEAAANQLATLMAGKSMLGVKPPAQPTNEEMFGGGVVTEEMAKAAENKWGNTFNNWMIEAQKPIAQKFHSEEEEQAYWRNIKVSDRDDGQSGY